MLWTEQIKEASVWIISALATINFLLIIILICTNHRFPSHKSQLHPELSIQHVTLTVKATVAASPGQLDGIVPFCRAQVSLS